MTYAICLTCVLVGAFIAHRHQRKEFERYVTFLVDQHRREVGELERQPGPVWRQRALVLLQENGDILDENKALRDRLESRERN